MRLFANVTQSEENAKAFEGLGIAILYLTTTAEATLLANDNEKRLRLAVLLPRLAKLRGYTLSECGRAVDDVYRWRNSFVHSGEDTFHDWNEDFKPGEKTNKALLVKRMIAKLLADAPIHLSALAQRGDVDADALWNKKLQGEWKKVIGI